MRKFFALCAVLALFGAAALVPTTSHSRTPDNDKVKENNGGAKYRAKADNERIPHQYIVVFHDWAVGETGDSSVAPGMAATMRDLYGGEIRHVFKHALNGYSARMKREEALALSDDPRVAYVEEDGVVETVATQSGATWGLDRVDQRSRPLSGTYTYNWTGSGVRVYVIDTGILTGHAQFGGRASNVYDVNGGNGQDCNGHGTHVSGTVGGSTYGVAKSAMLRGVKVFQCANTTSTSNIIAGVNWVTANRILPAVANMSVGGPASSSMDTAVQNLINSGVTVAVAAGNSGADACTQSPARLGAAITVGSTTSTDARSSFSNYGTCVDLFAPSSSITSAWYTSTTATNTISGTSMASPHVAGAAALYKQAVPSASPATIRNALVNNSTTNVITGAGTGSPNRLLYTLFF